jgi:hypothetical protein
MHHNLAYNLRSKIAFREALIEFGQVANTVVLRGNFNRRLQIMHPARIDVDISLDEEHKCVLSFAYFLKSLWWGP